MKEITKHFPVAGCAAIIGLIVSCFPFLNEITGAFTLIVATICAAIIISQEYKYSHLLTKREQRAVLMFVLIFAFKIIFLIADAKSR